MQLADEKSIEMCHFTSASQKIKQQKSKYLFFAGIDKNKWDIIAVPALQIGLYQWSFG